MRAVGKEQVGSPPAGKGERENRRCALVAGGSGAGCFRGKKRRPPDRGNNPGRPETVCGTITDRLKTTDSGDGPEEEFQGVQRKGEKKMGAGKEDMGRDTPPYFWDQDVRLPGGPTEEQVSVVLTSLMELERLSLEVEMGDRTGFVMYGEREIAPFLGFLRPMREGPGQKEPALPPILYFLSNPVVFADEKTQVRLQVRLSQLTQMERSFYYWQGFWREARRGLEAWLECQSQLREADARVRKWWPELPQDMIRYHTLARQSEIWLSYAQAHMMRSRWEGQLQHEMTYFPSAIWDPVQSLGEWGVAFLRAWRTGFFDVRWYYAFRLEEKKFWKQLMLTMQMEGRYLRGRYLMFHENHPYRVNPTYHKEYMRI